MRQELRNLPCTVVPDDQLWCIVGALIDGENTGGGILEWCTSEGDAKSELSRLQQDERYQELSIDKWDQMP